jgi:hypothetical protein
MSCFSELTYAMYADRELPADEARDVERHLAGCPRCRRLLGGLEAENRLLATVLAEEAAPAIAPATDHWRLVAVAVAAALVAALWLAGGVARPRPLAGLDWWSLAFDLGLALALNAGTVASVVTVAAVATMAALALAGLALIVRRPARHIVGLLVLGVLAGLPAAALGIETRSGGEVTVPGDRTTEGTLVAWGETIRIDGTVDGDLIVAARRVEVRGAIRGDLVAAAATVEIGGTVDGNVYSFAGSVRIRGRVARSLYGVNRATGLAEGSAVDGDLSLVGRGLDVEGAVGRSVWVFGETARIAGSVGRHLTVRAHRLVLAPPGRVGGDLTAQVESGAAALDPAVAVGGQRTIRPVPAGSAVYAEPRVYFWLGVHLFGAALLGYLALALVPRFFQASVGAVGDWSRSLPLGAAVLVGGPLAVLLLAATLVGLPLALIGAALYLTALYTAKIVVGTFIGRALLRPAGPSAWGSLPALGLGLLVLAVAGELPWLGSLVRLAVWCLGVGACARALYRTARPLAPAGLL